MANRCTIIILCLLPSLGWAQSADPYLNLNAPTDSESSATLLGWVGPEALNDSDWLQWLDPHVSADHKALDLLLKTQAVTHAAVDQPAVKPDLSLSLDRMLDLGDGAALSTLNLAQAPILLVFQLTHNPTALLNPRRLLTGTMDGTYGLFELGRQEGDFQKMGVALGNTFWSLVLLRGAHETWGPRLEAQAQRLGESLSQMLGSAVDTSLSGGLSWGNTLAWQPALVGAATVDAITPITSLIGSAGAVPVSGLVVNIKLPNKLDQPTPQPQFKLPKSELASLRPGDSVVISGPLPDGSILTNVKATIDYLAVRAHYVGNRDEFIVPVIALKKVTYKDWLGLAKTITQYGEREIFVIDPTLLVSAPDITGPGCSMVVPLEWIQAIIK